VAIVVGLIQASHLLLVVLVGWACRNTLLPDHDSYLSVARLLRTAIAEHGQKASSASDAKKLAQRLETIGTIRYRARPAKGGQWEAGLWADDSMKDVENIKKDEGFPDGGYL
jgi:hypothetical protein